MGGKGRGGKGGANKSPDSHEKYATNAKTIKLQEKAGAQTGALTGQMQGQRPILKSGVHHL